MTTGFLCRLWVLYRWELLAPRPRVKNVESLSRGKNSLGLWLESIEGHSFEESARTEKQQEPPNLNIKKDLVASTRRLQSYRPQVFNCNIIDPTTFVPYLALNSASQMALLGLYFSLDFFPPPVPRRGAGIRTRVTRVE